MDNRYAIVNKTAGNTCRSLKKYEKKQAQCYNTSLLIKSKAVKFFTAFLLDNCDAIVFCVDFGNYFCILRITVFKGTSKSSVFFVKIGCF